MSLRNRMNASKLAKKKMDKQNAANEVEAEAKAVVIDNGSSVCKAGFAGDKAPKNVFPAILGHDRGCTRRMFGVERKDTYIGNDVKNGYICGYLELSHPVENGIITNWDDMEKLWNHVYTYELRVAPEDHPCFLTEAPLNPKSHKEKTAQIMFEKFNVPSFYIHNTATLILYSAGVTSGCVIDVGDSVSYCAPVHNGIVLQHAIERRNWGGRALTDFLRTRLLPELGYYLDVSELDIVKDMKEKSCYVALDFDGELETSLESSILDQTYTLPDGHTVTMGSERFMCPEALFNPTIMGKVESGLHECAYLSIMKCDETIRGDIFSNIILAGGSSMFPGMTDRIGKEFSLLAPPDITVNVIAPTERQNSVWVGGATVAALSAFKPSFITKAEFAEHGVSIVHKKCIN